MYFPSGLVFKKQIRLDFSSKKGWKRFRFARNLQKQYREFLSVSYRNPRLLTSLCGFKLYHRAGCPIQSRGIERDLVFPQQKHYRNSLYSSCLFKRQNTYFKVVQIRTGWFYPKCGHKYKYMFSSIILNISCTVCEMDLQ